RVRRDGEEPVGAVVAVDVGDVVGDALRLQHDRRTLHPGAGLEAAQHVSRCHGNFSVDRTRCSARTHGACMAPPLLRVVPDAGIVVPVFQRRRETGALSREAGTLRPSHGLAGTQASVTAAMAITVSSMPTKSAATP